MKMWMGMLAIGGLWSSEAFAGMEIAGKPKVVFHAEGSPGFLTFDGVTRHLTLADDGTSLTFTVPMDTVETGITLRDQHMRDNYVQTSQFPNVVLVVAKSSVTWPTDGGAQGTTQATFEAHGVKLEVPVAYDIKKTKTGYRVKASFPFDTTQHGIEIPKYLGVTIKPAMEAEVTVDLIDA